MKDKPIDEYKALEEYYRDKKVEIKKMHSHNHVYGYFRRLIGNHLLIDKALIKPTNQNGLSQQLYNKMQELDVYEAIDKCGYRTIVINMDDVRTLEEVLSKEDRETRIREIFGLPEDPKEE